MMNVQSRKYWFPIAVCATLLISGFVVAEETSLPTGQTVITGHQVWEGEERSINERLIITPGGSLIVRNSTLDVDAPEECTVVSVNGNYCAPDIQVLAGASLIIEDSVLTTSSSDPRRYPTISADGGTLWIRDSDLVKVGDIVAQFEGGFLGFFGNTVTQSIGEIGVWRDAIGYLWENEFHDTHSGVGIQDASAVVRDNLFHELDVGMVIRVQSSIVGDKASMETAPLIENNVVIGGAVGLFTDSGFGVEIVGNTFVNQSLLAIATRIPVQDVILHRTPAEITDNVFVDQHHILDAFTPGHNGPATDVELEFHGNSIDASCSYIYASSGANTHVTVNATDNWWGHEDGPLATDLDDECEGPFLENDAVVRFDPWLTSPP